MDTILNKLERHCGIGACLSGDASFAQTTMNEAKAEIERHMAALGVVVKAWDSLKPGSYDKDIWETWLLQKMKPAVEVARDAYQQTTQKE